MSVTLYKRQRQIVDFLAQYIHYLEYYDCHKVDHKRQRFLYYIHKALRDRILKDCNVIGYFGNKIAARCFIVLEKNTSNL